MVVLALLLFASVIVVVTEVYRRQLHVSSHIGQSRVAGWKILGLAVMPAAALILILSLDGPVFGLVVWALGPVVFLVGVSSARANERRRVEAETVAALHLLRGLIRSGLSLPAALVRLESAGGHSGFCGALRRALRGFRGGHPFSDCLESLEGRKAVQTAATARCFRILGVAYDRGLEAGFLLDRSIPVVELELSTRERLSQLRAGAVGQAVICALLPWGVALVWRLFAPIQTFSIGFWGMAILAFEGVGVWEIFRASRFE